MKRVIPSDVWLHREPSSTSSSQNSSTNLHSSTSNLSTNTSRKSTWLIIGYKSLEKTLDSTLEATWKDWTGVRHIYLNLRHDFEICKISFLHRVYPQDNLDLFMYIVLMEIGNVDDKNTIWLLDFVQRMRVERMKGFITVYTEVEREISSIDDEYYKYINEDINNHLHQQQQNHKKLTSMPSAPSSLLHIPTITAPAPVLPAYSPYRNGTSLRFNGSSINNRSPILTYNKFKPATALAKEGSYLALTKIEQPSKNNDHDHSAEINGNLKVIEKLLEEIHQQPIGDYF